MRLMTFKSGGKSSVGVVLGDSVVDLGPLFGGRASMRELIASNRLGEVSRFVGEAKTKTPLAGIQVDLPIPDPEKIVCIGRNYSDHKLNAAEIPAFPALFLRIPQSLAVDGGDLVKPHLSDHFDYEGELAIIIGKRGRHVSRADALSHVFGYACFNDGSVRDYQFKHSLTAGKNFVASGSFGPTIVTADEIPDPSRLTLQTRLNGTVVQETGIHAMVFDVPSIISYVSSFLRLEPGDVIATGSPTGTGFSRTPPLWMKPGDKLEIEISGVGVLRNRVVAEA